MRKKAQSIFTKEEKAEMKKEEKEEKEQQKVQGEDGYQIGTKKLIEAIIEIALFTQCHNFQLLENIFMYSKGEKDRTLQILSSWNREEFKEDKEGQIVKNINTKYEFAPNVEVDEHAGSDDEVCVTDSSDDSSAADSSSSEPEDFETIEVTNTQ